jgi:hypothetical protein
MKQQRLLHPAGRLTRGDRHLDLDHSWPWTGLILAALDRLRTLSRHPP